MSSVHFHRGNGVIGIIYLKIYQLVYNTQSAVILLLPVNTVQHPTTPSISMGQQITELPRKHRSDNKGFHRYYNNEKALKSLLIGELYKTYSRPLRDKNIGYANMATLTMIMHLYTPYARFNQGYSEENYKWMK